MSHFSVLVFTEGKPSDDRLKEVLQPWHEFECTGVEDQYVVDVDITEEARKRYEEDEVTRLRDPKGILHAVHDEKFYRDPTPEESRKIGAGTGFGRGLYWHSQDWNDGRGYRTKIWFVPEGWESVEVPLCQVQTFRQYVSDFYEYPEVLQGGREGSGFTEVTDLGPDGEVIRIVNRTNPNRKWDWWVIGGRYSGKLKTKSRTGGVGTRIWTNRHDVIRGFDQACVADLDMEGMRKENVDRSMAALNKVLDRGISEGNWSTREEGIQIHIAGAEAWENLERRWEESGKKVSLSSFVDSLAGDGDSFALVVRNPGLDTFFRRAGIAHNDKDPVGTIERTPGLSCFALVRDGSWHQRGEMHMFGAVSGEKDDEAWKQEVEGHFEAVDPEKTWVTVVDCHI